MNFYELYLWDKVGNNYVNIPILIKNYLDGKKIKNYRKRKKLNLKTILIS
jgi:hypothetical protein